MYKQLARQVAAQDELLEKMQIRNTQAFNLSISNLHLLYVHCNTNSEFDRETKANCITFTLSCYWVSQTVVLLKNLFCSILSTLSPLRLSLTFRLLQFKEKKESSSVNPDICSTM